VNTIRMCILALVTITSTTTGGPGHLPISISGERYLPCSLGI
jgi:hypothetical protein